MIKITQKGNFDHTKRYFKGLTKKDYKKLIKSYAELGVKALELATPKDTGLTAASWNYEIVKEKNRLTIYWTNSNVQSNVNIALIIDKGHATGNGGYIAGRHYISPAIQPVFDRISEAIWKEVKNE